MRQFVESPIQTVKQVSRFRPADYLLSIISTVRAKLVANGTCEILPEKQQPGIRRAAAFEDALGNSPCFGGDLAPYKPHTDFTVMGTAYVPGGQRSSTLKVGIGLSAWRKSLDVIGDRQWHRTGAVELSLPQPFDRMALRLENAFGGKGSPYNPWGKGFGTLGAEVDATLPAANIHPHGAHQLRWDARIPAAGFGPLPSNLPPRSALRGTFDDNWLYKRKPLPPENFDWGFYNVAPADQQFTPYLLGGEAMLFEHLHPSMPQFTSKLPGLRLRILVRRMTGAEDVPQIEELHAVLDSVHVDTDAMTLDLAWRAVTGTPDKKASDVSHFYVATETLASEAQPLSWHVAKFEKLMKPDPVRPRRVIPPLAVRAPDEMADQKLMAKLREALKDLPLPPALKEKIALAKTSEEIRVALAAELDRVRGG
jgi:hypothetical protein